MTWETDQVLVPRGRREGRCVSSQLGDLADPSLRNFHQVDIIEHVNNDQANQITLHTGSEAVCKIGPAANFDGDVLGNDCRSGAQSNNGCGIKASSGSAGAPFNAGGGGVIVTLWDETELSFWMFARDKIPQDILDGCPDPDSWGTPTASWTNQSCDIQNAFRNMQRMLAQSRSLECDAENPFLSPFS